MVNVMILRAELPLIHRERHCLHHVMCIIEYLPRRLKYLHMSYGIEGKKTLIISKWGCLAFYRIVDPKRTKLGPRVMKSVFVGYAENSKAYRLLDLSSNTVVESRDVEFIENKFSKDSMDALILTQTQ